MSGDNLRKQKIIIGLKKARTSLDRIIMSLEQDGEEQEKCFSIIQQNLSVVGLLKSVNSTMLEGHLSAKIDSIKNGAKGKKELDEIKEEIIKVVRVAQKK